MTNSETQIIQVDYSEAEMRAAAQLTDGYHTGEVINEGPFAINVGDVIDESKFIQKLEEKPELSVDFWLKFPIATRPLKFVPGRNRREKRTFRKLADQQERGTISRGRKQRGASAPEGGNLSKLQQLYALLAATGNAKMSGGEK